jgi:hypothetical protein
VTVFFFALFGKKLERGQIYAIQGIKGGAYTRRRRNYICFYSMPWTERTNTQDSRFVGLRGLEAEVEVLRVCELREQKAGLGVCVCKSGDLVVVCLV